MWDTLGSLSAPLGWLSVAAFWVATVASFAERRRVAVLSGTAGWGLFGFFWVSLFPYFFFEFRSPMESLLSLLALPVCLFTGYLLYDGRESLLVLTRATALVGTVYLPVAAYEPATRLLVETVTTQTHFGMELFGYSPGITTGPQGFQSRFAFEGYSTYVVLACTGLGTISVFAGLIAAVRAPLRRKLGAAALAVSVIWVLNLGRNVFVTLAAKYGWFDYPVFDSLTVTLAGEGMRTSYFMSHHVIAQPLSVVVLLGITVMVVRVVPELLTVLDEVLYVVTGREYDLAGAVEGAAGAR